MTTVPPPIRRLRRQRAIDTALLVAGVVGFIVFLFCHGIFVL